MCFSQPQQPKPDINTPPYKPSEIGDNMALSYKPKGGDRVTIQRQPKDRKPVRPGNEEEPFSSEDYLRSRHDSGIIM